MGTQVIDGLLSVSCTVNKTHNPELAFPSQGLTSLWTPLLAGCGSPCSPTCCRRNCSRAQCYWLSTASQKSWGHFCSPGVCGQSHQQHSHPLPGRCGASQPPPLLSPLGFPLTTEPLPSPGSRTELNVGSVIQGWEYKDILPHVLILHHKVIGLALPQVRLFVIIQLLGVGEERGKQIPKNLIVC